MTFAIIDSMENRIASSGDRHTLISTSPAVCLFSIVHLSQLCVMVSVPTQKGTTGLSFLSFLPIFSPSSPSPPRSQLCSPHSIYFPHFFNFFPRFHLIAEIRNPWFPAFTFFFLSSFFPPQSYNVMPIIRKYNSLCLTLLFIIYSSIFFTFLISLVSGRITAGRLAAGLWARRGEKNTVFTGECSVVWWGFTIVLEQLEFLCI